MARLGNNLKEPRNWPMMISCYAVREGIFPIQWRSCCTASTVVTSTRNDGRCRRDWENVMDKSKTDCGCGP